VVELLLFSLPFVMTSFDKGLGSSFLVRESLREVGVAVGEVVEEDVWEEGEEAEEEEEDSFFFFFFVLVVFASSSLSCSPTVFFRFFFFSCSFSSLALSFSFFFFFFSFLTLRALRPFNDPSDLDLLPRGSFFFFVVREVVGVVGVMVVAVVVVGCSGKMWLR